MFVKNITGLWILQECEREWKREKYTIDYGHMQREAENSSFNSCIDVNASSFAEPGNMIEKIIEYCRQTSQKPPETKEEIFKCIVLGLAMAYREVVDEIGEFTGKKYDRIHIIGGGSRNGYLCGLTSHMTGMDVVAGPYEATVTGNIIAQLISLGEVKDINEGIEIINRSFSVSVY
jgi:sugar (pentulose or hexulose) kinase